MKQLRLKLALWMLRWAVRLSRPYTSGWFDRIALEMEKELNGGLRRERFEWLPEK